ncbi:hypothetical protein ACFLZR_00075 [Candidatus Neomarinimicrobiota bacterium]
MSYARGRACIILTLLLSTALSGQINLSRSGNPKFDLAQQLERSGQVEQALVIYYQLVEEFPGNYTYVQALKTNLRSNKKYEELLRVLRQQLDQNPNDLQAYVEVGDTYLAMGAKDSALAAWYNILDKFPENLTANRVVLSQLFINNLVQEGQIILSQIRQRLDDPAFYALDIGRLYASRLNYDLALDEFLLHLDLNPLEIREVGDRILQFPVDSSNLALIRFKLDRMRIPAAYRILADVEFKYRNFDQTVDLYREVGAPPQDQLQLVRDLKAEGEFDLAQDILEALLADSGAAPYFEDAVLEMAGLYLDRTQLAQIQLPLSRLYFDNLFFANPFVRVKDTDANQLRRAISLYDSLVTTWQNPDALLHLSDIRYRILDDFDGALAGLDKLRIDSRTNTSLFPEVMIRSVDIWIAKGDREHAAALLEESLPFIREQDQLDQLEFKRAEILFLTGDQDSLLAYIGGLLASLNPQDPAFNDLMEFSGLTKRFRGQPEAYRLFVESERLLRQDHRSEAAARLMAALDLDASAIIPVIQFRLAHLLALEGDYDAAEELCLSIAGNSEFNELGLLMAAEIADHMMGNVNRASEHYLQFIVQYPLSVHHDAARLRYRALNPQFN